MRFLSIVFSMFLWTSVFGQIPIEIGQWRTHLPYNSSEWIALGDGEIYCVANVTLFSLDLNTNVITKYDKTNGLSDIGVSQVEYDPDNDVLVIAYDNANLDVFKGNTIINFSDIKRSQNIVGDKSINQIYFFKGKTYLSASFGIVVLDVEKEEFTATYFIGNNADRIKVNALASDSSLLFAATEDGIKVADINSEFLNDFNQWELQDTSHDIITGEALDIEFFAGKVIALVNDSLFSYESGKWKFRYYNSLWKIQDISVSQGYLVISEWSDDTITTSTARITRLQNDFNYGASVSDQYIIEPYRAILDADSVLWTADLFWGLVKKRKWYNTPADFPIQPSGPGRESVFNLSAANGELWVAPGGIDPAFNFTYNRDGLFLFSDEQWSTYNEYSFGANLDSVLNIVEVEAGEKKGNAYFGSFWRGVVEFENGVATIYDKDNSSLQGATGDDKRTNVGGIAIDRDNNIWATNYAAQNPLSVRLTDGTWKSFKPSGINSNGYVSDIIIDDFNQKWVITPRSTSQGMVVYNHGDDILSTSDDKSKVITSGEGQGSLPTNEVLCMVNDREGEIWIGTSEGIAVIYCPGSIFSNFGCEAQQILVTQDGVNGYLLENESVTTIAVDGANRKWVGTGNGVFVLSPDGIEQIAYYNEDNSPLLDNEIIDIAIIDETGEVFIGTQKGIISVRAEATIGLETHNDVKVFPNPVAKNYSGPIAIRGLVQDANIKITDVNGYLIYETTAFGGQAIWNGNDYNGRRAKTGVYLVFSTNEDGTESYITKFLLIE